MGNGIPRLLKREDTALRLMDIEGKHTYKLLTNVSSVQKKFSQFRQLACVYQKEEKDTDTTGPRKRRRITSTMSEPKTGSLGSDLLAIAKVSFRLRHAKRLEQKKAYAPPPRLQFGSASGF
mmetsp:Transcript_26872/g.65310  ORF Transcript_26872/g.65310 Transcript_26872/m.65310 type:complete len:121 (+) Transcript_26872:1872-2234(+)